LYPYTIYHIERVYALLLELTQKIETLFLYRFFAQSKYASFQRQLNLYGFERMSGPRPTANAGHAVEATATDHGHHSGGHHHHAMMSYYHHPSFVRGRKELVVNMIRCKVKGTGNCHKSPVPLLPQLPSPSQPIVIVASEQGPSSETVASKSKKRTRASMVASSSNDSPPSSPRHGNSRNSRQSKKRRASTGSTPQEQSSQPQPSALPTVISPKAPRVASTSSPRRANGKEVKPSMPRMVSMTAPSLSTAAEQATPLSWPDEWDDDVMSLSDVAAASNASTTKANTTATSSAATATVISPLDGDLLYFEGSPFHYLDTILPDLVNPGTSASSTIVPQVEENVAYKDESYAPIQMVESPKKQHYQHSLPPPLPLFPTLEGCAATTAVSSPQGSHSTDQYVLTDDHDAMYGGCYRSHSNTSAPPSWAVSSPRQQLLQSRSRTTRMAIYNTFDGEHSPNSTMWGKRAAAATAQPFMLYNNNDTLIFPC
jgi:HSF-type DNA-binding